MRKDIEAKGAFEIHQEALALKRSMGIAFVELGRILKTIRDKGHFQVLGYDSFQSYVVNSELGFKRRTAYYYIEIYEWYVEKLSYDSQFLAEVGQDKLIKALSIIKQDYSDCPLIEMRQRTEDLINEVKELRPVDFEKKYKDDKANDGHDDYLAPPEYVRCEKCGKWKLIIPLSECCPEWLEEFEKSFLKLKEKNENQKPSLD